MNNKLKRLVKIGTLIFGTALLLTNCEKETQEEHIQTENQEPALTLKHYSRQEIEKNTKLTARLKKFNEKLAEHKAAKNVAKTVYNSEYDFTIYTDAATYIENGDYHSYTFPLVQDADEKMSNVLFESNGQGGYDAYLVRYDYTANEFNNQDLNSLSLVTSMEPINLDFGSLSEKTYQAYVCVYSYERHCSEGWVNGSGGNLGGEGERCYWVLNAGHCESALYAEEDYTTYQNNTATVTISGTNYGGTGGSQTSPTPSPFNAEELLKINAVKAELNLSHPERLWVDQHGGYVVQLHDNYLAPQLWSNEARAFGNSAIDAWMNGGEVDIEEKIINNLTGKAKCVYDKLQTTNVVESGIIQNTYIAFDSGLTFDDFHLSYDIGIISGNRAGQTEAITNHYYAITLDEDKITNRSALEVANTIIHESIHALLLKHQFGDGTDSFIDIFSNYITQTTGLNGLHHSIMRDKYILPMANALALYDGNREDSFIYESLVLSGIVEVLTAQQQSDYEFAVQYIRTRSGLNCEE